LLAAVEGLEVCHAAEVDLQRDEITAVKYGAHIQVSYELAHDSGFCTCGDVCTYQPTPLPPLSWQTRARYFLRRRWWGLRRLPGYRLAHKDELRDSDDDFEYSTDY
jgi:hypothetical protein